MNFSKIRTVPYSDFCSDFDCSGFCFGYFGSDSGSGYSGFCFGCCSDSDCSGFCFGYFGSDSGSGYSGFCFGCCSDSDCSFFSSQSLVKVLFEHTFALNTIMQNTLWNYTKKFFKSNYFVKTCFSCPGRTTAKSAPQTPRYPLYGLSC